MKIIQKIALISCLSVSSTLVAEVPDFFKLQGGETKKVSIVKPSEQTKIVNKDMAIVEEKSSKEIEKKMERETEITEEEMLDPQQVLLAKMKDKKKFSLETKSLFVDKKVKFIKLSIPIHQISEILVDKKIVKVDFLANQKLTIKLDQENAQKIILVNKDLNLDQKIKLTFIDGTSINFLLGLGNSISERHIEYKLYFEKKKIALLPEFQKKMKVRNIHTYFNEVATKLIIDKILQKDDFVEIEENKKQLNQILFEGNAIFKTLSGDINQKYKLVLNYVYETPFVKDTKREDIKKRLIMLELTIVNLENTKTLSVTPEFMKKRFGNYVTMYLGDLDTKENVISPKQSLRVLVVIEDTIKEKNIK